MKSVYGTKGDVRSNCGHKHKSIRTAVMCRCRDQKVCKKQGGYSDRYVIRSDGKKLNNDEIYEIAQTDFDISEGEIKI